MTSRARSVARSAVLCVAALASAGCGGSGSTDRRPEGAPNGGKEAPPAAVNLEQECLAGSRSWKTLLAEFRAEGQSTVAVTLAIDRGGRFALRMEPGITLVVEGGWLSHRAENPDGSSTLVRIPVGTFLAAAQALDAGRVPEVPDEPPALPDGCMTCDLRLSLDEEGHVARTLRFGFSLEEIPVFGWLQLLRAREGVTVRESGKTAVAGGVFGELSIDRTTGLLVDWVLKGQGGSHARLVATRISPDVPLDPALFVVAGNPPEDRLRHRTLLGYLLPFMVELSRRNPGQRLERTAAMARVYYRVAWTAEDIGKLSALGAEKQKSAAEDLRRMSPDVTDAEVRAASHSAAVLPIRDAVEALAIEDLDLFRVALQPRTEDELRKFLRAFEDIVEEALVRPAWERLREK